MQKCPMQNLFPDDHKQSCFMWYFVFLFSDVQVLLMYEPVKKMTLIYPRSAKSMCYPFHCYNRTEQNNKAQLLD